MCGEWEQLSPFQRAFSSRIDGDVPRSGLATIELLFPGIHGGSGTPTSDRIKSVTKRYTELPALQWLSLSMQAGVVAVWKCQLEGKLWTPVDSGSHCVDYESLHHNWCLNTEQARLEGTTGGHLVLPFQAGFPEHIPQNCVLKQLLDISRGNSPTFLGLACKVGRGAAVWRLNWRVRLAQSCLSSPRDNLFKSSMRIMLVKAFLEEHALLLLHTCDLDGFVCLCQKKWVTAAFFIFIVLFLLIFVNNQFFKVI